MKPNEYQIQNDMCKKIGTLVLKKMDLIKNNSNNEKDKQIKMIDICIKNSKLKCKNEKN